jgi:hypothetical protein
MQQQWQLAAVCTVPATVSTTGGIPHTLHDVLKQLDLTRVAVCDHRDTCNIFRKLSGDSTLQQ